MVLAKSSLFRFDEGRDREARLQKVLAYDYEKSEYYGQVMSAPFSLPPLATHFSMFEIYHMAPHVLSLVEFWRSRLGIMAPVQITAIVHREANEEHAAHQLES